MAESQTTADDPATNYHNDQLNTCVAEGDEPGRRLAIAVLARVVEDLESYEPAVAWEARRFATLNRGPWAKARAMWCDMAGVSPEVFRERIAAQLRRH